MLKLDRMRPPVRRVLALDAGSRCIKLLLAESDFGRLRILKEDLIDMQAEGLVSAEEIKTHLQASLDQWGRPPLALVLPQHLSISQVIDVPLAPESEVEKLIESETIKLMGVSESRIVYDFVRTETAAKNRQQFWSRARERVKKSPPIWKLVAKAPWPASRTTTTVVWAPRCARMARDDSGLVAR